MSAEFGVGDRVLVSGKQSGTVRFVGTTHFGGAATLVGVELDKPGTGRCDGSVDGQRYFECETHVEGAAARVAAVFVRVDMVQAFDAEYQASTRIQSLARRKSATRRMRKKLTARTWNKLDANEEDLHILRGKQVRDAITTAMTELESGETPELAKRRSSLLIDSDVGDIKAIVVEPGYSGVRLHWPLQRGEVLSMLEQFKTGVPLHYKYVCMLLSHFKKDMAKMKNVQHISIAEGERFTVVGDTHGQLQDLYTIFTINGLPSPTNRYLFNGDFVDRGSKGCEVFLSMLVFHFLYPGAVSFNRGNHEARAQTSWMGFEEEVLTKYNRSSDPRASRKLYNLFMSVFDMLPLAAVVQEKVFVCHGGLFRMDGVTMKHIDAIRRVREPPLEGTSLEDKIYEDLIWSDPRPSATYPGRCDGRRPSDRGAGVEFGADVTNRFCIDNSIALVLRSHECVQEGYEVLHDGRLITIFSASRYTGTQTNKGAFITFGPELAPEIQQFYAHSMEAAKFAEDESKVDEERDNNLEEDAIRMIIERVCDKKTDLYWYFTQHDPNSDGRISRLNWARSMKTVLNLDLPYLHLQSKLCDVEAGGQINYARFLERYRIQMREEDQGWQDGIIQRVCEKLFVSCSSIEEAFRIFDVDNNGLIEYSEFVNTLKNLHIGLTDTQIYELMRTIDSDMNSSIDLHEFSDRFQISFDQVRLADESKTDVAPAPTGGARRRRSSVHDDAWVKRQLFKIGQLLFSSIGNLGTAFSQFDTDMTGTLSSDQFSAALISLGMSFDETDTARIFAAVDESNEGTINYAEFIRAFRVDDTGGQASKGAAQKERSDWQDSVVQQVANSLFQHRIQLLSAFRMFDMDTNGTISAEEFRVGLRAINRLLPQALSNVQIDELRRALDKNNDGVIDYKEFLEGLQVVDVGGK